ncbi:MAG: ABC transporter ATP-binding protein [Prolixibacteraceae bacterium]|nr:ABC transporter ATP-binding protein [Prolixibacteraceae bacterium]
MVGLTKKYRSFTAVDCLNLTVGKGEIFGLLGPNGAGKSTAILMMLGLTEPTSGSVSVCGINSSRNPIEVKRKVGYLPEEVGFYDNRTAMENLLYSARLNSIPDNEAIKRAEELIKRVGLADAKNKKTGKYSRGMRQRLGLADVLIKKPEVIILDEPTSGIDPQGVRDFLHLIVNLKNEQGLTILFSSHNLHQVQQVCDRVGIFVSGKLKSVGNIESLSKQLFTQSLCLIEAGVNEFSSDKVDFTPIKNILQLIDGIAKLEYNNGVFEIECTRDLSATIAQTIVNGGFGLNFLNKKEFGLDEIYNRYFEGGVQND